MLFYKGTDSAMLIGLGWHPSCLILQIIELFVIVWHKNTIISIITLLCNLIAAWIQSVWDGSPTWHNIVFISSYQAHISTIGWERTSILKMIWYNIFFIDWANLSFWGHWPNIYWCLISVIGILIFLVQCSLCSF